jgi:hypothetical protein
MNKLQDKLAASVRKARAQSAASVPAATLATADGQPPAASAAPAPASAASAAPRPVAPSFDFPDRVWPD